MQERRRAEAELMTYVYETVRERRGEKEAIETVRAAVEAAARNAGEGFAARAAAEGRTPSLAHFATIVDVWKGTGVLDIRDMALRQDERGGGELTFRVTRCGYVDMYREMGLPEPLIPVLSCPRDEPFAQAYSEKLQLERPATIADGGTGCPFRFVWS